jgi:transmembrane sensor
MSPADIGASTAWMSNRLEFRARPLSQVLAELERWYDVELRLGDSSLAHEPFTATFAGASFNEVMTTLTTVLKLSVERHGRTVVLHRSDP